MNFWLLLNKLELVTGSDQIFIYLLYCDNRLLPLLYVLVLITSIVCSV